MAIICRNAVIQHIGILFYTPLYTTVKKVHNTIGQETQCESKAFEHTGGIAECRIRLMVLIQGIKKRLRRTDCRGIENHFFKCPDKSH